MLIWTDYVSSWWQCGRKKIIKMYKGTTTLNINIIQLKRHVLKLQYKKNG